MKTLLASIVLSISSFAFSETSTVHFSYFGNDGRNQTYYACSYVEDEAYSHLETLGAMNIETRCSGGIQPWGVSMPISLTAKFTTPVVNGNGTSVVEIEGDTWNPNCDLNTRMINAFLKEFQNIKVLEKRDGCGFRSSNYYYKLEIKK